MGGGRQVREGFNQEELRIRDAERPPISHSHLRNGSDPQLETPGATVSDEDTDLQPLTPAMLLTGFKHDFFPVLPVKRPTELSVSRHPLQRYRYLQSLIADFWKRWKSEYLALLHQREKATKNIPNLAPGELVLIQDDLSAPAEWPMGRILETYPGADSVVRSVKLRTQRGEMDRPVVKLRRLPVTIAVYRNDRMDEHDSD